MPPEVGAHFELAARVGKTHGMEGQVTAHAADGLPLLLRPGMTCHVVPPALEGLRRLTVTSVDMSGDGRATVAFDEVACIDDAEVLVGRWLLVDAGELESAGRAGISHGGSAGGADAGDAAGAAARAPWTLVGCVVDDERFGRLGEVTEVVRTPANDVAVVEGVRGEVLIPLVDEAVLEWPEPCRGDAAGVLRIRVMDGLINDTPTS